MEWIWHVLLVQPLVNILIGLYNTIGFENLGLAIVWLTVLMRIVLLPLSLKDDRRRAQEQSLKAELAQLRRMFANNPTVLREEQRKLMRTRRFRRWPRVLVLFVQAVIFVVLYQVFVHGININKIVDELYRFVHIPVQVNTYFLGINIAKPSYILTSLCALLLMGNIWFDHALDNRKWTRSDMAFFFGFPALTFIILIMLPAVKSLFVLSSMVFSDILMLVSLFRQSVKEQERIIAERASKKAEEQTSSLPHPLERFR